MSDAGNGNTLTYRVTQLERDLERLENRYERQHRELVQQVANMRESVLVLRTEFKVHTKAVNERLDQLEGSVNEDVKGLRKVLLSVGAAVLIAALTFAITSLAVFGGPG